MSKIVNAFVQTFTERKAREQAEARAEYLALLHRLAHDQPAPEDTDERVAAVLDKVGRTPMDFAGDVDDLAELVRFADLARDLSAREAASREARTALADARAELKRVIADGEARLAALDQAYDRAADRVSEAHDAREQLLDRLGDRKGYYARLDDLRAAQEAGEGQEAQKLRAGLERVTAALLDLAAFDPFRPRESPP